MSHLVTITNPANGSFTYSLHDGLAFSSMFDGYKFDAVPTVTMTPPQVYLDVSDVARAIREGNQNHGLNEALGRMNQVIVSLASTHDLMWSDYRRELDFWKGRAEALETENELLRNQG